QGSLIQCRWLRHPCLSASSHSQNAVYHSPYHALVNPNPPNQVQHYAPHSTGSVLKDTLADGQQQPGASKDKYEPQRYYGHNEKYEMKENYPPYKGAEPGRKGSKQSTMKQNK
uniref:Uncharacterized protein n=1 Tax=Myripristis murdjan TaxID=586833 RepID=A0A667WL08_9TELE